MAIPSLSGPYTLEQVERHLRETAIPVRLACLGRTGAPVVLSLWFLYRDGALWCASRPTSHVVRHLARDPRCAFEVARDDPPYRGVRGQGRASLRRGEGGALLGDLLDRYLGGRDSPLARRLLAHAADEVAIRVEPTRLVSWDYSERMRAHEPGAQRAWS